LSKRGSSGSIRRGERPRARRAKDLEKEGEANARQDAFIETAKTAPQPSYGRTGKEPSREERHRTGRRFRPRFVPDFATRDPSRRAMSAGARALEHPQNALR
jgi:hypothetical protein